MFNRQFTLAIAIVCLLAMTTAAHATDNSDAIASFVSDAITSSQAVVSRGTLSVEARAIRTVMPDIAILQFGIKATEKEQDATLRRANEIVNTIIKAVNAIGVEGHQITTESYKIDYVYDDEVSVTEPIAFSASVNLGIRVYDFSLINLIIDTTIESGASEINDVYYSHTKQSEVYRAALMDAITAGREKAENMANAAGVELLMLETLAEKDGRGYSDPYRSVTIEPYELAEVSDAGDSTQVLVGQLEIPASVIMTYKTK